MWFKTSTLHSSFVINLPGSRSSKYYSKYWTKFSNLVQKIVKVVKRKSSNSLLLWLGDLYITAIYPSSSILYQNLIQYTFIYKRNIKYTKDSLWHIQTSPPFCVTRMVRSSQAVSIWIFLSPADMEESNLFLFASIWGSFAVLWKVKLLALQWQQGKIL